MIAVHFEIVPQLVISSLLPNQLMQFLIVCRPGAILMVTMLICRYRIFVAGFAHIFIIILDVIIVYLEDLVFSIVLVTCILSVKLQIHELTHNSGMCSLPYDVLAINSYLLVNSVISIR